PTPPPPPTTPLFPYTTLFRSERRQLAAPQRGRREARQNLPREEIRRRSQRRSHPRIPGAGPAHSSSATSGVERVGHAGGGYRERSEEHTSELQSRFDLVCRLL